MINDKYFIHRYIVQFSKLPGAAFHLIRGEEADEHVLLGEWAKGGFILLGRDRHDDEIIEKVYDIPETTK